MQKIGTVSQVKKSKNNCIRICIKLLYMTSICWILLRDYFTHGGYSMSLILNLI